MLLNASPGLITDVVIIVLLFVFAIIGYSKGFVKSFISTTFVVKLFSQVLNALRSSLLVYTHFFTRSSSLSQKNLLDSFTSFCSFPIV